MTGQTVGTYFNWGMLALLLAFKLLTKQYWHAFLSLITALATLSVYQSGVIIGYRAWSYITIILGLISLYKTYFSAARRPGIFFWFMLLILGTFHLFFIEQTSSFLYSRGQLVQIATGLSAFAITCYVTRYYHGTEYLKQFALLLITVNAISLIIPQNLSLESRLGVGLNMDPNGLGTIAILATLFTLLYLSLSTRNINFFHIVPVLVFIGIVLIRTGSRNSIATAILLIGLYLITDIRIKHSIVNIVLIASVFIGLAMFSQSSQLDYLNTRFDRAIGSEGRIDRLDHLLIAGTMAWDNPMGLGGGGFKENYREYSVKIGRTSVYTNVDPHNLFGMALADWGIPGGLLLIAGFIGIARGIKLEGGPIVRYKYLALFAFIMLANSGMSLNPIFMSFLAFDARDEN